MPASDYTSTISGGLKLKGGAKDAGVKKKSKKSKTSKDKASKPSTPQTDSAEPEAGDSKTDLALTTTPSSRDATPSDLQPSGSGAGSGKTEAQRRHEEIKRKRVSYTRFTYTIRPCRAARGQVRSNM
jgi:protein FAM32A